MRLRKFSWAMFIALCALCFIAMFMLVAHRAHAQTAPPWHTANATVIAWDASDGSSVDPVIPQDQISYRVYLANFDTDPSKANPSRIGETANTTWTITLTEHGRYLAGVSAIRTVDGEVVGESEIQWSDTADPPFGIRFFNPPPPPGGLKVQ